MGNDHNKTSFIESFAKYLNKVLKDILFKEILKMFSRNSYVKYQASVLNKTYIVHCSSQEVF